MVAHRSRKGERPSASGSAVRERPPYQTTCLGKTPSADCCAGRQLETGFATTRFWGCLLATTETLDGAGTADDGVCCRPKGCKPLRTKTIIANQARFPSNARHRSVSDFPASPPDGSCRFRAVDGRGHYQAIPPTAEASRCRLGCGAGAFDSTDPGIRRRLSAGASPRFS